MRRALIVIDVQHEYIDGRLPIGFPATDVSLPNIGSAMDVAAAAGIPVVVVQQVAPETSPLFARGSHEFELHDVVGSRPHDVVIEKTLPSALAGTDLADWLTGRDIDTVTLVGYMTQNCVESTARDAAHRGLAVEVLSDATGTLDFANSQGAVSAEVLHRTVLVVLHSRFAAVTSTTDWISAVESGEPIETSNIVASAEAGRESVRPTA